MSTRNRPTQMNSRNQTAVSGDPQDGTLHTQVHDKQVRHLSANQQFRRTQPVWLPGCILHVNGVEAAENPASMSAYLHPVGEQPSSRYTFVPRND